MTVTELRRVRPTGQAASWLRFIPTPRNASALYLFALIFLIFGLWIPSLFLTSATMHLVVTGQIAAGMVTLAILIPFVAGVFDLSVGAMLAFSLVIIAWFAKTTSVNIVVAALIALAACSCVGAISGIIVVYFRVNSFIATLGISQVLTAVTLLISKNTQIVGVFGDSYLKFGQGDWLGIPKPAYYLFVLALLVWYVLEMTPLGRRLFAAGSNPEAAKLAGINTNLITIGSLVGSAFVAGLAGVVYGMQVGNFSNSYGSPLLFPAFAALFFGSTQFKSRPNVWGSMLAVFVLAFGVQGLQLHSPDGSYWITPFFDGAALLIAVSLAGRSGAVSLRRRSAELAAEASTASAPQEDEETRRGA
jgi:ribose transport system permease protein